MGRHRSARTGNQEKPTENFGGISKGFEKLEFRRTENREQQLQAGVGTIENP